jgi:dCMP deaminase
MSSNIHKLIMENISEDVLKNISGKKSVIDFYDNDGNTVELCIDPAKQNIKFNYKINNKKDSKINEEDSKINEEDSKINEEDSKINLFGHVRNLVAERNSLDASNTLEPEERLDWDEYFMSIALLASCRSPCKRLHVGCAIVKDNRLISMGYNGFIAGTKHASHIKDGHEQATVHSETNAITDCAKRGVSLSDSTIYVTHYPCLNCFKTIASSGIKNIIYLDDYNNNELVEELNKDININISQIKK